MTGNIRVISERLQPKNLVEDCRKSRIPTLKLIRFFSTNDKSKLKYRIPDADTSSDQIF